MVPNRPCDLALDGAQQIIVEKQNVDAFTAPNFARVVERLAADRFVVYGVVTEICVLHAARGLLKYGKPVTIVTDAIAALDLRSLRTRPRRDLRRRRHAAPSHPTSAEASRTLQCNRHTSHEVHRLRSPDRPKSSTSPRARRQCRAPAKS